MMVEEGLSSRRLQRQRQPALSNIHQDLGNVTIEHVQDFGNEAVEMLLFEDCQSRGVEQEDVLDIGIEATDLNSLLEQFEETEASLQSAKSFNHIPTPQLLTNGTIPSSSSIAKVPLNNKKTPVKKDVDPKEVAKKIAPAKRKTAILLDPLYMPSKRMRGKPGHQSDSGRECRSLPSSRSGSPVPHQLTQPGAKLPGFNYLNLEHDYCTGKKTRTNSNISSRRDEENNKIEMQAQENIKQIKNAKHARAKKSKDPIAAKAAANQRKQLYKKRYKLKKKVGSENVTPEGSEQGDSNLLTNQDSNEPISNLSTTQDSSEPTPTVSTNLDSSEPTPNVSTNQDSSDPTPNVSTNLDSSEPTPNVSTNQDSSEPTPNVSTNLDSSEPTPNVSTNLDSSEPTPNVSTNQDSSEPTPNVSTNQDSSEPTPNVSTNQDSSELTPNVSTNLDSSEPTPNVSTNQDSSEPTPSMSPNEGSSGITPNTSPTRNSSVSFMSPNASLSESSFLSPNASPSVTSFLSLNASPSVASFMSPNESPSSFITSNASPCVNTASGEGGSVQEKRLHYFDKIPDYFPNKLFSMYQEIECLDQAKVAETEVEKVLASDTNSYSQAGNVGSDTSYSQTVNTAISSQTKPCEEASCDISESVATIGNGGSRSPSPSASMSSCSRPGCHCSGNKRTRKNSRHSHDSCSTCSSRSPSQSGSRSSSREGHKRRCYSSYSSRSWSSQSRSHSRSRSKSRISSRSRSTKSHPPSRSRSWSRSHSRTKSRHPAKQSYSLSRHGSPQSSSGGYQRKRRKRKQRYRSKLRRDFSSHRSRSRSKSRSKRSRSRSPRSRSPRSRRSRSRRSRSRSRRTRSRSTRSRSTRSRSRRSRSRRSSSKRSRNGSSRRRTSRRSSSREHEAEWRKERWDLQMKDQMEKWEHRRVVYVGRITDSCNKLYLYGRFERYGEIEKITLHFRDEGDNYAFVTFRFTCDAYAAIEGVNNDGDELKFDVCFGGRRQFCQNDYADLDSMNQEENALEFGYNDVDESHIGVPAAKETDFDLLLKQAMNKVKK